MRQERRIAEAFGDLQRLPCPACGGSEPFFGQYGAQRDAECGSAVAKQDERVSLGVAIGGACLQPSDQGPQFVDGVHRTPGLPGDFGESDGGVAILRRVSIIET
jgi:hypothetical protein